MTRRRDEIDANEPARDAKHAAPTGGAVGGASPTRRARTWPLVTVMLALMASAVAAAAQRSVPDAVVSDGTLSFDAHASVGDFAGTTRAVSGQLMGGRALTAARGWVEAPVRSLVTGNEHRDRDLYKAMDADRYPMIRFDLTSITPGGVVQGDSVDATLHGTFTARGVTHDVDVPVAIAFGPESIAVRGQFPLDLKDYRIHGLSRMLGLLKVDEHIVVHVALGFRPSDTIHASATAGDPGTSGGHARRSPPNAVADSSQ